MNKIYLVRHGENRANLTKELSYLKIDYPLTDKGRLQAQQTAEYFRDKAIDKIFASPLKRAAETARIIGLDLSIQPVILEDLREINIGILEGMADTDESWRIHNDIVRAWVAGKPETRFPGGDDFNMGNARMLRAMRMILSGIDGCTILIVGHGGLFFTSVALICQNITLQQISGRVNHNCSVSELEAELIGDQIHGRLLRWADVSHIHGEAANFILGYRT